MAQRRRFSAEYKREAVAMLESPGVSISQIAAELGIGVTVLGRWRRELRQESAQAFRGNGRPRDGQKQRGRKSLFYGRACGAGPKLFSEITAS